MILPIVKNQIEKDGFCRLPAVLICSFADETGKLGAAALASFDKRVKLTANDAFITFSFDDTLEEKAEIYRVTVEKGAIRVGFRDRRGAVNGAASVALLLRKKKIACGEIVDYPDASFRGLMVDPGYGVADMPLMESTIRYMALAKYNYLHLHLIDKMGPGYVSKAVPEYKFSGEGTPWTLDTLREIDQLCKKYAIEIIPEIEVPGHATAIAETFPDFKCQVKDAQSWTVCAGNEDLYTFVDKLIGELAEVFPDCTYMHIGTDEIEFTNYPEGPLLCHWTECPRCAALRKREGLADMREEFYYMVERCRKICLAHGKKMMMWSDQIDVSRDTVNLSRDILMDFWRVAAPGRGPHEGCTFEKLLEKGFTAINSFYRYAYTDEERFLSSEKMKTWTPHTMPEQSPAYAAQVPGGKLCIWGFAYKEKYGYYGYVAPAAIMLFGQKLWNFNDLEYTDEYKAAFAEYLFGGAEYACIFDCVGDVMPPKTLEFFTYLPADQIDLSLVQKSIDMLKANTDCFIAGDYIELLEHIAETARNAAEK